MTRSFYSTCLIPCLLLGWTSGLAGQAPNRKYSVIGPRPTPEQIEQTERVRAILVEGWSVTPAEAVQGEASLARDSGNLALRMRLMSYYVQYLENQRLLTHVLWFIENHPDSDAFRGAEPIFRIQTAGPGGKASSDRARCDELWKKQAQRFARDPRVLRNAALWISQTDPGLAVQYIQTARQVEPANGEWTRWLAKIYADSIRWTFWDGKSMMAFTGDPEDYRNVPFWLPPSQCATVKKEMESSGDGALVRATGEVLLRQARLLADRAPQQITPDVPQWTRFGELLVRRGRELRAAATGRRRVSNIMLL